MPYPLIQLALQSFALDTQWVRIPNLPEKYLFLWKKYIFLIFYPAFKDANTRSYRITLWNRSIYLENRENIGILQSVFVHNHYLKKIIRPNGVIIDVGAHTGEFALFCDIYLHAKSVYSFEPIKKSYELLAKNKQDRTYHMAIGTAQHLIMHIPKHSAMTSPFPVPGESTQERTDCAQLDAIPEIQALSAIDLLKIDVEGMEYDVLAASTHALKKSHYLLLELSVNRPASQPAPQTIAYITSIIPNIALEYIGQIFRDRKNTIAADLLFRRPTE